MIDPLNQLMSAVEMLKPVVKTIEDLVVKLNEGRNSMCL